MKEYEEIKGGNVFGQAIQDKGMELNQSLHLENMRSLRFLFQNSPEKALKTVEQCSLKYQSFEEIDRAIKQREFSDQVKELREAQLKGKKSHTFEEMCIPIEEAFKITIDPNISVSKFVAWENRLKEKYKKSA
jgi:hypothetical protein